MNHYYNTTSEAGKELLISESKAKSQDELIHEFFRTHDKTEYSPEQIWKCLFTDNTPLTSVRRSISNLTKRGLLEQTENMVDGSYGKKIGTWRLFNPQPNQQIKLF